MTEIAPVIYRCSAYLSAAEDCGQATCLTPATGPTIRALADLAPRTLGLMHGPSYSGDCPQALRDLAAAYDERLDGEIERRRGPRSPAGTGI